MKKPRIERCGAFFCRRFSGDWSDAFAGKPAPTVIYVVRITHVHQINCGSGLARDGGVSINQLLED